MMEDDYRYYETLGLDRNASLSEITKAYRSLAKTYHPDVSSHPRARDNFQKIQQAYEILSDPESRGEYDAYLDTLEKFTSYEDTDEFHIEHEFYVLNEPITINGRSRILDSAHHVIANGQEFIKYNGEFLPYDRGVFPFDARDIDGEFYVPGENITIDGKDHTFTNAHHVGIRGQEYIECDGDFLLLDRSGESGESGGGFLKTAGKLIFVLVIAFTLYHGYIIATSGDVATPSTIADAYSDSNTLPADYMQAYELYGEKGTVFNIHYEGNAPVDLMILDPENYYIYDRALDGLGSVDEGIRGKLYLNKNEVDIKFTQPDDQQYRLVIDNTYLMTNGANSGRPVTYSLTLS